MHLKCIVLTLFETNKKQSLENKPTAIKYEIAKNYFVKNTVTKIDNPKNDTAEAFNQIFGMATKMGINGKPTSIDFAKKYVIAVILPETNLETIVNPISLSKNEKAQIELKYKVTLGQKQSYTTVPNFAIVVDKYENGPLIVTEAK